MKQEDLQALTRALQARAAVLRGEVSGKLEQAADDSEGGRGGTDSGEQAFAASESAIDLAEADRDLKELAAIDAALSAIGDGTYGTCISCGLDVGEARLRVQPLAMRCITCQSRDEQQRGEHHARL
jgi:DnaK suppressor protein